MRKPNYARLRLHWYRILKEQGFVDIEDRKGCLRDYHDQIFLHQDNHYSRTYVESKIIYFRMATRFLQEYEFESELDRFIWELHSEGADVRDIARRVTNTSPSSIQYAIKRLRKIMCGK